MNKDSVKVYQKESEPTKRFKIYAWSTAIGLQDVDGLKVSQYLVDTAIKNIEGEITLSDARDLIDRYHTKSSDHMDDRLEEADKVASRIVEILVDQGFSFTPVEYLAVHRRLFTGIYNHAGQYRDYNITKKEWGLNGKSVTYGETSQLADNLQYDLTQERDFDYEGLSMDEVIHHLTAFVSLLWQNHIFEEGNTRTTAVFFIKYLRTLGFDVTNDVFAEHARYFRNALVRANYRNVQDGIFKTTEYLELFLRNLLLNEDNPLHNRDLRVRSCLLTK